MGFTQFCPPAFPRKGGNQSPLKTKIALNAETLPRPKRDLRRPRKPLEGTRTARHVLRAEIRKKCLLSRTGDGPAPSRLRYRKQPAELRNHGRAGEHDRALLERPSTDRRGSPKADRTRPRRCEHDPTARSKTQPVLGRARFHPPLPGRRQGGGQKARAPGHQTSPPRRFR